MWRHHRNERRPPAGFPRILDVSARLIKSDTSGLAATAITRPNPPGGPAGRRDLSNPLRPRNLKSGCHHETRRLQPVSKWSRSSQVVALQSKTRALIIAAREATPWPRHPNAISHNPVHRRTATRLAALFPRCSKATFPVYQDILRPRTNRDTPLGFGPSHPVSPGPAGGIPQILQIRYGLDAGLISILGCGLRRRSSQSKTLEE